MGIKQSEQVRQIDDRESEPKSNYDFLNFNSISVYLENVKNVKDHDLWCV